MFLFDVTLPQTLSLLLSSSQLAPPYYGGSVKISVMSTRLEYPLLIQRPVGRSLESQKLGEPATAFDFTTLVMVDISTGSNLLDSVSLLQFTLTMGNFADPS